MGRPLGVPRIFLRFVVAFEDRVDVFEFFFDDCTVYKDDDVDEAVLLAERSRDADKDRALVGVPTFKNLPTAVSGCGDEEM
mmetsp:Transcript_8919/g.32920  ORF Transcript_8919/g.32920 Transcript_8919/m.32920 type:complete len:81 (+) Transcript_8919:3278-3520(+)